MTKGIVFDIKEFTVHDGSGVRVTVFLKGCPLRCRWCHNPEGLSPKPQLLVRKDRCTGCGKCFIPCKHESCRAVGGGRCLHICPDGLISLCGYETDAAALSAKIRKFADVFEIGGGGVTFSGGEPLMQPAFLLETIEAVKPLHTAVETSGYGDSAWFLKIIGAADQIFFDIKHFDSAVHREYTGVGNEIIMANLKLLMDSGKSFTARLPVIPGVNDGDENMEAIAELLRPAGSNAKIEKLPYNRLAGAKYGWVDGEYTFAPE